MKISGIQCPIQPFYLEVKIASDYRHLNEYYSVYTLFVSIYDIHILLLKISASVSRIASD